jgi:hypothetical protein
MNAEGVGLLAVGEEKIPRIAERSADALVQSQAGFRARSARPKRRSHPTGVLIDDRSLGRDIAWLDVEQPLWVNHAVHQTLPL